MVAPRNGPSGAKVPTGISEIQSFHSFWKYRAGLAQAAHQRPQRRRILSPRVALLADRRGSSEAAASITTTPGVGVWTQKDPGRAGVRPGPFRYHVGPDPTVAAYASVVNTRWMAPGRRRRRRHPSMPAVGRKSGFRASSPSDPAIAYCQGTPLRNEIEAQDASRLQEATKHAAEALALRFGSGSIEGRIRAFVITAIC